MNLHADKFQSSRSVTQRIAVGAWMCFALAIFISLYSWAPLLDAGWSVIDDHEIVSVIGASDRLPVSAILPALQQTELGNAGTSIRFRPSYYGLRFLEAATWGKQPHLWYAARIFIFLFFALLLASISLRIGGALFAFPFLAFALSRPYWLDVFGRLGPAETYAVFGTSLVACGFIIAAKKGWLWFPVTVVAFGVIIAAGSKENFAILALVPLWLIFSPRVRLSPVLRGMLGVALAYVAWIVIEVVLGLIHAGHDVYANPVSVTSRFGLLSSLFARRDVLVWLAGSTILLLLTLTWERWHGTAKQALHEMRFYIIVVLSLLALFASQYIFYMGNWPESSVPRYWFPGVFAKHLAIFVFFVVVAKIVAAVPRRPKHAIWIIYLLSALYFAKPAIKDFEANRMAAKEVVAKTVAFKVSLDKTIEYLRAHPTAALIVNSNSILDYESLYSIERFIRAEGLANPIALNLSDYSAATFAGSDSQQLSFKLATALEKIREEGEGNLFIPLNSAEMIPRCFSIGLSGAPYPRCKASATIAL